MCTAGLPEANQAERFFGLHSEEDMRTLGWLLAAVLVTGLGSSVIAQTPPEKTKPATKVYSYYKKAAPTPQSSTSTSAPTGQLGHEPAYGTQEWWRMRTERFTSGDGGGSQ